MECRICKQVKNRVYKTLGICETCGRKVNVDSFLDRRYDYMLNRCNNKRAYLGKLKISREDFKQKFRKNKKFLKYHKEWVDSGFNPKLVPSVDRINPNLDYTARNMRFIPWWINEGLGRMSRKRFGATTLE